MGCCGLGRKSGLTAKIIRIGLVYDGKGTQDKTDIVIHESITTYMIKVGSKESGDNLAEITNNQKRTVKVGKKTDVQIGDKVELTQKSFGLIGTFEVEDLNPISSRGRMSGIYLYLKKYNES